MDKEDKHFIEGYEKLLNKGYCNCNEMNCIDNNSPRRILNIVKQLQQENKELQEKINVYEDPEDLTLMFMYCNEKAKDKIKELHNKIDKLSNENHSLRTRIKTIKRLRKKQTQKKNKYKSILIEFQKALEKKNNKIDKAIEIIDKWDYSESEATDDYYLKEDLLEILKDSDADE